MKRIIITLLFVIGIFVTAQPERAEALYLPDVDTGLAIQYGDFYSYSLPVLNYYATGEETLNSGDPYYVASNELAVTSPVIMSGKAGNLTNTKGFEDAYYVDSSSPYSTITHEDPTSNNGIYRDSPTSWEANIDALVAYLGTGNIPIFYFNNNEPGSAAYESLYIKAELTIWSSSTLDEDEHYVKYGTYYLTDPTTDYELTGADPALPTTGYVLSGGYVCLDEAGASVDCGSEDAVVGPLKHNLGTENAAYAAILPALNDFLAAWSEDSIYDMISLKVTMAEVENGPEQAFIGKGTYGEPTVVPEPSTWLLLGLGMLCLPLVRRFRRS